MLSIVVNDALLGIDVKKKYPVFFAQMLVDADLRRAFLDVLEILEQSQTGQLPEYAGPSILSLDFLLDTIPEPRTKVLENNKWQLAWRRTRCQLQKMFEIASWDVEGAYRYNDMLLDESYFNILRSRAIIEEQELEISVDVSRTFVDPETLNLIVTVFSPTDQITGLTTTIAWGSYLETVEVNHFGLARFPSLKNNQILDDSSKLTHGLECRLLIEKLESLKS
jgi:hypothetical protein